MARLKTVIAERVTTFRVAALHAELLRDDPGAPPYAVDIADGLERDALAALATVLDVSPGIARTYADQSAAGTVGAMA